MDVRYLARLVPDCMFTDPPLAHVGLREREAQRDGIAAKAKKWIN